MHKLYEAAGRPVESFVQMLEALAARLDYFRMVGTTVSDDGIPKLVWEEYTEKEIESIWQKAVRGEAISEREENQYISAFLFHMGQLYHDHGFIMQLHIGTYLDCNRTGVREVGQSCGFDCTDAFDIHSQCRRTAEPSRKKRIVCPRQFSILWMAPSRRRLPFWPPDSVREAPEPKCNWVRPGGSMITHMD